VRPDLTKLISDTLPVISKKSEFEQPRWVFKSTPDGCTVYAVSLEFKSGAKSLVPARLVAFDLRAKQVRLLKSFAYEKSVEGMPREKLFPDAKLAISPSGKTVAVYFSRDGGISVPLQERPAGIADLLLVNPHNDAPEVVRDMRRASAVRDLAFLSDNDLLLVTHWLDDFRASVHDLKSLKGRVLCTGGFGTVSRKGDVIYGRRSPSAISQNAKLGLLAAVIHDEVRILRYKRNPKGTYTGGPSEC
jgi:hypothetical protein